MKQKKTYVSPKVKTVSFKVEQGFAASGGGVFTLTDNDPVDMENASSNTNEQFNEDRTWYNAF